MREQNLLTLVESWQQAANTQNTEQLFVLSSPDIEIVGPRGSGRGHQLLGEWLARAGLHMTTLRAFARGEDVVLQQQAVWRSVENGIMMGEATIASRFRVKNQQVIQFARYDTLELALAAAGLNEGDELI